MAVVSLLVVALSGVAAQGKLTCGDVKGIYQGNECCGETESMEVNTMGFAIGKEADPPVPGVLQGSVKAHVLLGMSPDYPPYTSWSGTPLDLGGFNMDFAKLMLPICGIKVDFILSPWSRCWTAKPEDVYYPEVNEYVGTGIINGQVHGCTAYTHTKGERGLSIEFTHSILGGLKTGGILTRLENGVPVVSPSTYNYTGIKLGDVAGWAPTRDTFVFNQNYCAGQQFFTTDPVLTPVDAAGDTVDGNAAGINALLDGTFDALYLYADQMSNFLNSGDPLADGFGTTFAFIHTGLDGWSYNGTTLAMSKRGSGLKDVLDPCIYAVSQTQNYTEMCESYWSPASCIQNQYSASSGTYYYDARMSERTDSYTCSDGYCTCSE
jgi:hypothetical protein